MSGFKSVLISGGSGMGKSTSLKNIRGQEGVLYMNCDGGKPLPFRNKFKHVTIDDPYEVQDMIETITQKYNEGNRKYTLIVIDTISFLMDRYESVHVNTATNTMKAWGNYGNFFRDLMMDYVAKCPIPVIFLGHLDSWTDENSGETFHTVPVKGALKKAGLEAYFTTVINAKKVKLKELTDNELLNISNRDQELGFKHVFQTRTTKKTIGDRIRSPDGLFGDDELYIDNDIQTLLDRLKKYYSEE